MIRERATEPDTRCEATRHGRLMAAHGVMAANLALQLRDRVPPRRMARLYASALSLCPEEAGWLRRHISRAVPDAGEHGLLRFHAWLRLHAAPWGDAALAETLEAEFARCKRFIGRLEVVDGLRAVRASDEARPSEAPARRVPGRPLAVRRHEVATGVGR